MAHIAAFPISFVVLHCSVGWGSGLDPSLVGPSCFNHNRKAPPFLPTAPSQGGSRVELDHSSLAWDTASASHCQAGIYFNMRVTININNVTVTFKII